MLTNFETGYLELITGPMFSGKTTRLRNIYKQMSLCDISALVVNYIEDIRYSDDIHTLYTHDKSTVPCISVKTLSEINEDVLNVYNVILINEGQFFEDLYNFTIKAVNNNKHIYICGLDGDSNQNKFGNILDLIPKADNIVKLSSICAICKNGTPAPFTIRLSNETTQVVIGVNNYKPVCRKCLQKLNC